MKRILILMVAGLLFEALAAAQQGGTVAEA